LSDTIHFTEALRVQFLVKDTSGQYETGAPYIWQNKLVIRNELKLEGDQRKVALSVVPQGRLRYTLDGSEARQGNDYLGPIAIGNGDVLLRAFAEAEGLEGKADFRFAATTRKGLQVDAVKPAAVAVERPKKLDARTKVFNSLELAKHLGVEFESVTLAVGNGAQIAQVTVGEIKVAATYLETLLKTILEQFDANAPVTLSFRKAYFQSGHDLQQFTADAGIEIQQPEVVQ
jgi:hypothetical protein